jgi:hypothetical protein
MSAAALILLAVLRSAPIESQLSLSPDFAVLLLSERLAIAPAEPPHRGRWALIGALSGIALGTAIGFLTLEGRSATSHWNVPAGALIGGVAGAGFGYAASAPPVPPKPAAPPQIMLPPPPKGPPPPYQTAWLVGGIAGGVALGLPVGIMAACHSNGSQGSPVAAVALPLFWTGIGAVGGHFAAEDHDAAKGPVFVLDVLGSLMLTGLVLTGGKLCGE